MKKAFFFLTFLFFSLLSENLLFANTSGYEISTQVYNKFYEKNLKISTQNIVISGENQFPYNIIVQFDRKNSKNDFFNKKLLFIVDQEQSLNNLQLIKNLIEILKKSSYDFDLELLFSYGDVQKVFKQGMISGSQVFLNNSNLSENTTVVILDFSSSKNSIITSSNGTSSPSFLVKTGYNIFLDNKIESNLPTYYISQQNKYHFFVDNQLNIFFQQGIPAIKFSFSQNEEQNKIIFFCSDFIENYSKNTNYSWDQHFIIIKFFNNYYRITEQNIVRLIIFIFFASVLFISLLSFINSNKRNTTWKRIKKIWFSAPLTFLIILASFFFGKGIYFIFRKCFSLTGSITFLLSLQLILSFLFSSTYYVFQLKKGQETINEKSIDFVLIFSTGFNLIVFSFIDISLFPLMLLIFILAILMLIVKNRQFHIVIFFLMCIPLFLYVHTIISNSDLFLFKTFFTTENIIFIPESLILTPIILTYFRIFASFKTKLFNYKRIIITIANSFCFLTICIIFSGISVSKFLEKENTIKIPTINKINADLIEISYSDNPIFSDTIRTLKIKIPDNTFQCSVILSTNKNSPILYSDYDFEVLSPTQASFLIPYKPGSEFSFIYGTENLESEILVNIITGDETLNIYSSYSKIIKTGLPYEK